MKAHKTQTGDDIEHKDLTKRFIFGGRGILPKRYPAEVIQAVREHAKQDGFDNFTNASSQLGKVQSAPTDVHYNHLRHVLAYCKKTRDLGIVYTPAEHGIGMAAYADASWADDKDRRRSTGGYICFMSNGPISWHSRVMRTVALSTAESELMAACEATKDICHLRNILHDFGNSDQPGTTLGEDNTAALAMSTDVNQSITSRSRHIGARHFWLRQHTIAGWDGTEPGGESAPTVEMYHVPTAEQTADIMTKALPRPTFELHRKKMLHYVTPTTVTPAQQSSIKAMPTFIYYY